MKPLLFLSIAAVAHAATPVSDITVPPGFKVELLREAGPREGSWISMALDAEGRIYISPQGSIPESGMAKDSKWGGLWRVTVDSKQSAVDSKQSDDGGSPKLPTDNRPLTTPTKWERVPVPVGDSMGMLWAFDSLYVSGNGPEGRGIYRCKDTDGDSLPDTAVMWKRVPGGAGEHGAHALVLSPDKKNIYIVHGNSTGLIDGIAPDSPYRNWGEDDLIPKLKDPTATFFDNIKAPYGYVLRTDEHGKKWELIAGGFRNTYDIDFNADGELFTYDSDMEWDRGLPWYRPTRVLHIVPGGEYGFREGSAKWPAYYPDSLPAVVDVGLGCPTGVKFGTAATGWPEKYRRAFFACDWTYGRILAVHMREKGASYTATNVLKSTTFPKDAESSADVEPFVVGKGMPVTDVEFLKDGSMVFTTGGRGTSAGLYRVSYGQDGHAARDGRDGRDGLPDAEKPRPSSPEGPSSPSSPPKAIAAGESLTVTKQQSLILPPEGFAFLGALKDLLFSASADSSADAPPFKLKSLSNLSPTVLIRSCGGNPPGLKEEVERLSSALMEENLEKVLTPPNTTIDAKTSRDAVRHTASVGGGSKWIKTLRLVESGDVFAAFATMLDAGHRDEMVDKSENFPIRPAVIEAWRLKGKTPADSRLAMLYALASARGDKPELQEEVFRLLKEFPLKDLPDDLKLLKLRILQLTFARHGRPSLEWQKLGLEKLLASYPAKGERAAELNRELSQLLIWLSQPQLGDENAAVVPKKKDDAGEKQSDSIKKISVPLPESLESGLSSLDSQNDSLGSRVESLDKQVDSLGERVGCLGERVYSLDSQVGCLGDHVYSLYERVDCLLDQVYCLDERVYSLGEHVYCLLEQVGLNSEEAQAQGDKKSAPNEPVKNPGATVNLGRKGADFHAELGREVIERTLALMDEAKSQEEQIHYALVLRWAHGWTPQQRERYFRWFHEKGARLSGGNSLAGFIRKIHTEAAGRVPDSEKAALAKWLAPLTSPAAEAVKPRAFVKAWTLADLEKELDALKDRKPDLARGRELYAAAQCSRCHLFKDAGGNVGPDLSAVAQRFQRRDILEAIVDPNKVVSDQYALTTLTVIKFGGGEEQVTGLLQEETSGTIRILTDPFAGTSREFYHNVVRKKEKAAVSLMPPALLNTLTAEEVADLLAFLGGR